MVVGRRVLVIGGAGYIGSHVAHELGRQGFSPVIYDNFSTGHRAACGAFPVIEADLTDLPTLVRVLSDRSLAAVVHLAAHAYVGESVREPAKYYRTNVLGSLYLLEALRATALRPLVVSASCTTYGHPRYLPIDEHHPQQPVSPYGFSKLALEQMVRDYAHAYGLRAVLFRYFNAAGASAELGEDHDPETHLIPLVLRAARTGEPVTIFGTDYPTPDGTCVRDYVHVQDLAQAHVAAVARLLDDPHYPALTPLEPAEPAAPSGAVAATLSGEPAEPSAAGVRLGRVASYNLGNERGYSVREVLAAARWVTGRPIPVRVGSRRPGDPAELVASSTRARAELAWRPRFPDLATIVRSAWAWQERHPHGYRSEPAATLQAVG